MALDVDTASPSEGRVPPPGDAAGGGRPTAGDGIAPPLRRRSALGSRRRQVIAAVVILAALGTLAAEGLSNATIYFKTADQAVAQRAALGTKVFRIEGTVGQKVTQAGQTVDFTITANGVTVPIVDSKSPPELFKPGIPVVLEGHWQGPVYASDQIMVKHTASYVEAHPNRVKPQPTPAVTP